MTLPKRIAFLLFPILMLVMGVGAQRNQRDSFKVQCFKPAVNLKELASDTLHTTKPFRYFIEYRDEFGKLVCFQLHENPVAVGSDQPFDIRGTDKRVNSYHYKNDKLVYESIVLPGNKMIRCYNYEYGSKRLLIYKQGYDSDERGVSVYYEYDDEGRLQKETQRRASGVRVMEYLVKNL